MNETTREIDGLLRLARAAERASDLDSARQYYARCLELDDGSDSLAHHPGRPPVRYVVRISYADFLRDRKDPRGALGVVLPAAGRWPDHPDLLLLIGSCHDDLSELDAAEDAYRKCASMDEPRFAETRVLALSFLADVLRRKDRGEESLQCLYTVLEIEPNYEEAHYNIGCEHSLNREYAAATERFRKAIEIDPDYARAHAELGFALLRGAQDLGKREKADAQRIALQHVTRAVELDPTDYWAPIYLANLLWQLGRTREARAQYETNVRAHPRNAFILMLGAHFLSAALGAFAQADAQFRKAVQINPDDPLIRYEYGKHLLRVRRYTDARRELLLADKLGDDRALGLLASMEPERDD